MRQKLTKPVTRFVTLGTGQTINVFGVATGDLAKLLNKLAGNIQPL
jgi:hypothetical protein